MRQQLYKLFLYLLCLPYFANANTVSHSTLTKTHKEKTINKSFDVNANATLKVKNTFGNINIITWNDNKMEFNVTVKVSGNDSEKVQDRLNNIDIEFSSNTDMVSAITRIEKNEKKWWNWSRKMNLKMEINYVIKIPITGNVDLTNKFGAITLDKLEGTSKIRCDHGSISTKELLSETNNINFNHTRDNFFEYINKADISATHSGFTIINAKNVNVNTQHTRSVIETAEVVNFNCQHGSLKIENINSISGKSQHFSTRIGNLYNNAKLKNAHGALKIAHIAAKANSIIIDSQFTGVTLGYDSAFNFNFDVALQFGALRDADQFNFTNKEINLHNKKYKGYYGTQNSENSISIKSQHGSVSFKQQ